MKKQVILITGASSGIGRDAAIALAQQGHIVYGGARRQDKLASLKQYGTTPIQLDVTDQQSAEAAVAQVIAEQDRIDVLFNNAGFGLYGAVEDIPLDEAKAQFEVNLFGLAKMTQLVVPYMRQQRSGTIINTSSVGGRLSIPLAAWYHASKFSVEGLTDTMRLELKAFNINLVLTEPGLIVTDFYKIATNQIETYSAKGAYQQLAQRVVKNLSRVGRGRGIVSGSQPAVIAKAVLKAVNAKHPKTRYLVGGGAKPSIFVKHLVSDKIFDRLLLNQMAGK